MQKLFTIIAILIILIIAGVFYFYSVSTEDNLTEENKELYAVNLEEENSAADLVAKAQEYQGLDVIYGVDHAPIKIIEYISYGCPHCAEFFKKAHQGYLQKYVDNEQLQLILRDFPLDEPSLRASQLVHCTAQDQRKNMVSLLLEKQQNWAHSKNFPEKLENIAKISGMSGGEFHECMQNRSLEESILESRVQAYNVFKVNSTPTIIINGVRYLGVLNNQQLPNYLDKLLNQMEK